MSKEQTIAALASEIARLRALPDEPMDKDGEGVIYFTKRFRSSGPSASITYRYTAVRVPALDRWFVSGGAGSYTRSSSGTGYTWEELLEHIKSHSAEYEIWWASSYEQIDA